MGKCGSESFSVLEGSSDKQTCAKCGNTFDLVASVQHLQEVEAANAFMLKPESNRANQLELATALEKRLEYTGSSAPPRHPAFLQLINTIGNCYHYASLDRKVADKEALQRKSFEYKHKALLGLKENHGGHTNQRDAQYMLVLYKLVTGSCPVEKE